MKPKDEWLKEFSKSKTKDVYRRFFDEFCEWAKTDDAKLVEEYQKSDPREFAKIGQVPRRPHHADQNGGTVAVDTE